MGKSIESRWNAIYKSQQEFSCPYDFFFPHPDLEFVSEIFQQYNVHKILDLGCGLGRNLLFLSQRGFDLVGVDSSSEAINRLQAKLSRNNLSIPLFVGVYQSLPFPDQFFDGVICIQTLQHGYEKDVQQGIREILRVLNSKGLLFLTIPGRIAHHQVRYSLVKTAYKVDDRVYIPTQGKEKGIPHYIFNMRIIRKFLRDFTIFSHWRDKDDYYCIFARKK